MYCKNCGKKLPDNARFCDRCNASVRQKEDKMDLIEELKEERLARRQNHEIEEKIKKVKKVKRKRRGIVAGIIIGFISLGIISGLFMYINYTSTSHLITSVDEDIASPTPEITKAPAVVIGGAEATPGTAAAPGSTAESEAPVVSAPKPRANSDGYVVETVSNIVFAYPYGFDKGSDDTALLSLTDGDDGATITLRKAVTASEPKDLLRKFADETGGKEIDSIANDTGYSATISVGNTICHRKSIVSEGNEIYYELRYKADSEKASSYESCIAYMDEKLSIQ